MASTYVDNFTLIDVVNAQSVSATQYNSNEGGGTLNPDLYQRTGATTYTIPATLISITTGALLNDGMSQKSLYEVLLKLQVNWDTAMLALDNSSGVAATTFTATAALGSLAGTYNIHPNGIGIDKLAVFLQAIATKFAVCTALCDADSTLTDTDYASTLDFTMDTTKITTRGAKQGDILDYLNTAITNINLLWVKLDADI